MQREAPTAARPLDPPAQRLGRVREKLAALLQKSFPDKDGFALTWRAEWLYPATGSYRTNYMLDCWRWEGFARHYRPDGSYMTMMSVGSYETMSALIKADKLTISGADEVVPE